MGFAMVEIASNVGGLAQNHYLGNAITSNARATLRRLLILRTFVLCSFVGYTLFFSLNPSSMYAVGGLVVSSALFAFISWRISGAKPQWASRVLVSQLVWESIAILVFVWFAGRSNNPFIYYFLVVVAISASILPERFAWFFAGVGIAAYSALIYLDVGHHMSHMDSSFKAHLLGMWVNFTGSALLLAFFIARMSAALKQQERALNHAREENLKNEQLIGIGTIAASTLHSFGTPLSTIAMTASELNDLHKDEDTQNCTQIIQAQILRLRETMQKLTALTARKQVAEQQVQVKAFVKELAEYLQLVNAKPMPNLSIKEGAAEVSLPGGLLLLHAIINLIDNAVDAANTRVGVSFEQTGKRIKIEITDDGKGFITGSEQGEGANHRKGMGIGLMLVNSTIERLNGTVQYSSPKDDIGGNLTRVTVTLPTAQ